MCSRYEIDIEWDALVETYGLVTPPVTFKAGEIRPTDKAITISGDRAQARCWGLPAPWDGKPLINARAETLERKPTFQPLLNQRCLIPAHAYFEWRKVGKLRLKNRISLASDGLMSFAGLFTDDHFAIITCAPSPAIAHIHNRMPVILPETAFQAWGDPARPFEDVRHFLAPFTNKELVADENTPPTSPQGDLFGSPA